MSIGDHNNTRLAVGARGNRRRRRGYILIIVLGFAAVASSLGIAFLDASSTIMPEAMNYVGAMRGNYLAGSGVNLASHYLMYPPTSVNYGQYWTGGNAIAVDSSSDYTDVAVLRSDSWSPAGTDLNLFRVTATGVAKDVDGTVRAKRVVTAEVLNPENGKWKIPYAYLALSGTVFPFAAQVFGNIHSNAGLNGSGWCQGALTAVGICNWTGTGPPSSISAASPSFTPTPSANPTYYNPYVIQGHSYAAYTGYTANDLKSSDTTTLNAMNMGANNPGRVIIAPAGTFTIKNSAQLTGTLVVNGNCDIDDPGLQITPLANFPALVVWGDLRFSRNSAGITLNGPLICSGRIRDQGNSSTRLDVYGTTIIQSGFTCSGFFGLYRFYWDQNKSKFWDFQNVVPPDPVTILSWKEN